MSSLSILLNDFVPKVKTGDDVVSGQVIATKKPASLASQPACQAEQGGQGESVAGGERGKDIEVDVAEVLDIKPGEAVKFILKRPGDRIEEGGLIAAKKGVLGIGGKGIRSKVSGTVFKIDEDLGILYIRVNQSRLDPLQPASPNRGERRGSSDRKKYKEEDIFSPVDGVVELCDNKKIAIKTDKDAILADKVSGKGIVWAETILLGKDGVDPDSIGVDPSDLNEKIRGKIILGRFFQREAISKALGIGALGIISQNISDEELEDLRKKNIDTPIFIINEENFEELVKYNGKKIYADAEKSVIIPLFK